VIDRLPKLRLLAFTGARNASVDIPACTARGITVCNTTSRRKSHNTAELTLAIMLAAARRIPQGDTEARAGRFQRNVAPAWTCSAPRWASSASATSAPASPVMARRSAMHILAWSTNLTDERAREVGVEKVSKEDLMSRSDIITLHLVLSDRTRGIVGAADIARMKPGAMLVNTSRGPLIDTKALVAALHANKITAAIDVFDSEPPPPDHPCCTPPTPCCRRISATSPRPP